MQYGIHTYGDNVLREKATPVSEVDDEMRTLAGDMIRTMRAENGVGLAAEQVGRTEAICVVDIPAEYDTDEHGARLNPDAKMPLVLINPVITDTSEETAFAEEGCLSFPGIYASVERFVEVTVNYLDTDGKEQSLHLKRFVARAVQHELDHLNGVLLVDRMSHIKKIALSGQLKRMKKETREKLGMG